MKRNIGSAADTVQKTGMAGYRVIGQQVSTHTGVQLPGTTATPTTSLGSPVVQRKEDDYEDFWAENGIKDVDSKKGMFVGQTQGSASTKAASSTSKGKDDEWENW